MLHPVSANLLEKHNSNGPDAHDADLMAQSMRSEVLPVQGVSRILGNDKIKSPGQLSWQSLRLRMVTVGVEVAGARSALAQNRCFKFFASRPEEQAFHPTSTVLRA
jgi:hypothetical protein